MGNSQTTCVAVLFGVKVSLQQILTVQSMPICDARFVKKRLIEKDGQKNLLIELILQFLAMHSFADATTDAKL